MTLRGGRRGNPARRLRVASLVLLLVLGVYVARLVQVQGFEATAYAQVARNERLRTVTLTPARGQITDSAGRVLALSVTAVDVTIDPTLVPPAQDDQVAAELTRVLGRAAVVPSASQLAATLRADQARGSRYLVLAQQVTPALWDTVNALGIPGVLPVTSTKRVYPDGQLAANVIGFVGAKGTGMGGIEYELNSVLAGKPGTATYEVGADGQRIPDAYSTLTPPVQGTSVRLTINADIQWMAQQAIAERVKQAGASSGTVVVMDVHTGQILALATVPTFNPNDPGAANPADLGNRAVSDVFEPGSTAKLMTASAAIQQGVATPATRVVVPNDILRAGTIFHDDMTHPTWHLTFAGIIARSSNVGTIEIAERMSPQTLYSYLTAFGIGQPMGLGFPGDSPGLLAPPSQWSGSQRYTIPFGQGFALNAVQDVSAYATIANGGVRVQPSLIAGYTAPDGTYTPAPAPHRRRVVSPATATAVTHMLEQVITGNGTAPMAAIPGYVVAGKTGTANRDDPACGCYRGYTASFVGFAPADAPVLATAVILEDPVNGHFGGMLGGPVFKSVMSFALQTLKVPPTGAAPVSLPLTW
ncbi:MAG: peptidoglycan D,D-transpeptidase FtsI family protein [Actinomycetes bacterium]